MPNMMNVSLLSHQKLKEFTPLPPKPEHALSLSTGVHMGYCRSVVIQQKGYLRLYIQDTSNTIHVTSSQQNAAMPPVAISDMVSLPPDFLATHTRNLTCCFMVNIFSIQDLCCAMAKWTSWTVLSEAV
eukprot:14628894-Ditylum_brightwellii.AAC.1